MTRNYKEEYRRWLDSPALSESEWEELNSIANDEKEIELKKNLTIIYDALVQKGYNPINQIVGYILSEDPTYITTYNNARSIIRHIDRDELLQVLVKSYLGE